MSIDITNVVCPIHQIEMEYQRMDMCTERIESTSRRHIRTYHNPLNIGNTHLVEDYKTVDEKDTAHLKCPYGCEFSFQIESSYTFSIGTKKI